MKEKTPLGKKWLFAFGGFAAGILNGLLGAGGGTIAVPVFRKSGLKEADCHATSVAVILPLCLLSAVLYLFRGDVTVGDALPLSALDARRFGYRRMAAPQMQLRLAAKGFRPSHAVGPPGGCCFERLASHGCCRTGLRGHWGAMGWAAAGS